MQARRSPTSTSTTFPTFQGQPSTNDDVSNTVRMRLAGHTIIRSDKANTRMAGDWRNAAEAVGKRAGSTVVSSCLVENPAVNHVGALKDFARCCNQTTPFRHLFRCNEPGGDNTGEKEVLLHSRCTTSSEKKVVDSVGLDRAGRMRVVLRVEGLFG